MRGKNMCDVPRVFREGTQVQEAGVRGLQAARSWEEEMKQLLEVLACAHRGDGRVSPARKADAVRKGPPKLSLANCKHAIGINDSAPRPRRRAA